MAVLTKVAKKSDIPAGTGKVIEAGGKQIALFNCDGTFYATENTCAHRGGPLRDGSLAGQTVTCPWHGWSYDVTTGACQTMPSAKVKTFEVKVDGEDLLVSV